MTQPTLAPWTITGSENLDLFGDAHIPVGPPKGVAVLTHGYKGYKDYGFIPSFAHHLAQAGIITHRYNLAHSGMTNDIDSFARTDLFERDTWAHQVEDIASVVRAVRAGALPGAGLPVFLIGHSRGGTATLLAAAWQADVLDLAGIVTINAPDRCCSMDEATRTLLLEQGYLDETSSRTGQKLHVGAVWLQDQLDHPTEHDLHAQCAHIRCPVLVLHGDGDTTVEPASGDRLVGALGGRGRIEKTAGGDHVLNTPNPTPMDAEPGEQLAAALKWTSEFVLTNS